MWNVDLAKKPPSYGPSRYDDLHRLACRFFEADGADHGAEDKQFAIRLTSDQRIVYTWLGAEPPPGQTPPRTVKINGDLVPTIACRVARIPYQRLEAGAPMRRAALVVTTPAKFRHNGRDYPLPDPHITFSSLGRHYLKLRPAAASADQVRALARAVVVYSHDIHTERFTWHGRDSAGFVGRVEFGIPRATGEPMWRLFGTLCRFAALAGLGHGTTHGLGATDLQPGDPAARLDSLDG